MLTNVLPKEIIVIFWDEAWTGAKVRKSGTSESESYQMSIICGKRAPMRISTEYIVITLLFRKNKSTLMPQGCVACWCLLHFCCAQLADPVCPAKSSKRRTLLLSTSMKETWAKNHCCIMFRFIYWEKAIWSNLMNLGWMMKIFDKQMCQISLKYETISTTALYCNPVFASI